MHAWKILFAAGLVCCTARFAPAAAATTYGYQYIAEQNAYSAPINSNLTISLYLNETTSDNSQNSLIVSEHGLLSAGVAVSYGSGNALTIITGAAANNGAVPTGFDDPSNSATFTSTTAAISESTDPEPFGTDTIGVGQLTASTRLFLGTISIHTGATPGVITTFNVGTADSTFGATFTNDNAYDLDSNTFATNPAGAASLYTSATGSSFTITTSATPEPTSLCALIVVPLLARRRCRRF